MIRTLRSLVVSFLALWRGLSQKELSSKTGIAPKRLSYLLKKSDLDDEIYERLLAAVRGRPAHVAVVTACLEDLEALDQEEDLTAEERDEIAMGTLEGARLVRTALIEAARLSRAAPPDDDYPQPEHLEPARWRAGVLFNLLKDLPEEHQLAVVRVSRPY